MSTWSIPRPEAECGMGAGQAEPTHAQDTRLPFICCPQPLTAGEEAFPQSLLLLFQGKIPGHEMSVPVGVYLVVQSINGSRIALCI